MIQNKKIFLFIIITIVILVIFGIGGFFAYKYYIDMQERKSLEYELGKPSEISELPNNIPIYSGAHSTSYSVESYLFIAKDLPVDIIRYYTDYFSKSSQYSVSKKRWCGDAQAMFCAHWVDTLTIKNNDGQNEFVIIDISEYKTGSRFILTFSQSNRATDWKTYTDNKYGFEFKYPVNTSAKEDRSGGAFLSTWNIYTQNPDGSMKDLIVSFDLYSKDTVKSFGWENGRDIPNQTAIKNANGDVMYITLENENYKDFYNSVVSSFKFTTSADLVGEWKIFEDPGLFKFEYPVSKMNVEKSPVSDVCNIEGLTTTCTVYSTTYWSDNSPYYGLYVILAYTPLTEKIIHKYDNMPTGGNPPVNVAKKNLIDGIDSYEYELVSSTNYKIHGVMIPLNENSYLEISENSKSPKVSSSDWKRIVSSFKRLQLSDSWNAHPDIQYGIEFKYPGNFSVFLEGPNAAQKDLDAGKTISGTIQPSYQTISFRDSSGNSFGAGPKKFEISIFHKTDKDLSEENYINFFNTSGLCDLRYLYAEPTVNLWKINDNAVLEATSISKTAGLSRNCYYLKNSDGNLIVLSLLAPTDQADFEATKKIVKNLLSTFKLTK